MSLTTEQLLYLTELAYLKPLKENLQKLNIEINSIMNFVAQLQQVDTTSVTPLMHPMDNTQRLRPDEAVPCMPVESLAAIAPLFKDNLYLVPKVL
jgi:aspartyl-tRNA(Asn)/glutamyl-tRNA(Gln) amidotransferase subunit C